ncbi:MAG TPA: sigma-70 family RNA polymerase sigma factor [Propionibacteriaceae bacterium]|nr:sigma-70 family RNA polymerase sigma factor [Propionibacteriaceae bacterium]
MDKQPFSDLVSRHGPTVYRVCRALAGPVDAEDAWSETFVSALKAYPDLPPDANTEAWLVRIAQRKAIDLGRARKRRPVPTATIPDQPIGGGAAEGNDELLTAIAALPLRQRQAVAFHHLAGRPYAEVAELIGGTPDAARRAASDGIASLRKHFVTNQRKGRS